MNQKQVKYSMRKKSRYFVSEISDDDEEENGSNEKECFTKGKRKSRQRQENSLGELTKNFINYIKDQGGREININEVVRELKVKKRRIYDITNVLEGIGYIKKLAKNKIQWLKDELYISEDEESEEMEDVNENSEREILEKELQDLNMEENKIDSWMENIKTQFEKLTENNDFKEYGYVTFDDIKALTVGEDINLIAIKAPTGTSLEIPDPDQINSIYTQTFENMKSGKDEFDQSLLDSLEKRYQLFLDSPNGEINVYLVLSKLDDESKSEISIKTQSHVPSSFNLNLDNSYSYNYHNHKQTPLQQNRSYKNLPKNYQSDEMINNFS